MSISYELTRFFDYLKNQNLEIYDKIFLKIQEKKLIIKLKRMGERSIKLREKVFGKGD